jgi:hypothetical protein
MTIGAPLQGWVIDHDFIKVSHYKPAHKWSQN